MPIGVMASSSRALGKLASRQLSKAQLPKVQIPVVASRAIATSSRRTALARRTLRTATQTSFIARQSRRAYADAATPPAAAKAAPKKRRFRVFRWVWRLTYLSALGGVAYISYGIYQDRHPEPQTEADPNKKTLVILGKLCPLSPSLAL